MKKLVLFIAFLSLLAACNMSSSDSVTANSNTTFALNGMTCEEMCAKRIESKISRMKGVKSCEVNFEKETATLLYDDKKVELDNLIANVESMSDNKYSITDIKTEKISNSNSESSSSDGEETGSIMSAPSFELPNIMEYLRNII